MNQATWALLELTRYCAGEATRWRDWLRAQDPALLALPVGEAQIATVGRLLAHVAAVDRMYANTLAGTPSGYEWPPADSLEGIFTVQEEAFRKLVGFLEEADAVALEQQLTLRGPVGRISASAGKMVAHTLVHGIRHYAQLATALRAQGHRQPWQHDLILGDGFGPPGVFTQEAAPPQV